MVADGLAIDLRDVAKTYKGKVQALQGISMQVGRGEVFGLLGPNGAGKSTLVKIIMTVIHPTRAEGMVLGQPLGHKRTLRHVGYLPENHRFPRYLTGRQTLEFFGALAEVDRPTRKKRAAELLDLVGITSFADRKVSIYSKGMMQRIGVAQALMNDPKLVLLDEPTDGVDPVGRLEMRQVFSRIREQGRTVFINSHLLSELEAVCDRVAILAKGVVVRQGTIEELTRAKQRYEIEVDSDATRMRDEVAGALPQGTQIDVFGPMLSLHVRDAGDIQGVIDVLRKRGVVIKRIESTRQSLEDLFIETVRAPGAGDLSIPGAMIGKGGGR